MAEPEVVEELKNTVSINGKDIINDHISNIKIKNISEQAIEFESGVITPDELGTATAPEAEALSKFIEKV